MDKKDFKNNLKSLRDQIEEDFKNIDKTLRNGKYRERINKENQAATLNYYQLTLQKRDPVLPDPTLQDYENTADVIQVRKDQLDSEIMKDIKKEFEDKNLIEQHIDQYFYDQLSKDKAREHIFHPAKTAFNEGSKKSVSRNFIEQVQQKVQNEKDDSILRDAFGKNRLDKQINPKVHNQDVTNNSLNTPAISNDSLDDIPELETHEINSNEVVQIHNEDHYPITFDNPPPEGEPLDFSDNNSPSISHTSPEGAGEPSEPEIGD